MDLLYTNNLRDPTGTIRNINVQYGVRTDANK